MVPLITKRQIGLIILRNCKSFGVPLMALGFILIHFTMFPYRFMTTGFMVTVLILSFFDGVIK